MSKLSKNDRRTVARILKVNHAGEAGAVRIYQSQLFICRYLHPALTGFLSETLAHEVEHKRLFRSAMSGREARPCRALWLWGMGGWILGAVTALAGKQFVWICTEAVEETVHRHLDEQLIWLEGRDPELAKLIANIQTEELSHLDEARSRITNRGCVSRFLHFVIVLATEIVIWLSTQGDSTKMAKSIDGNATV